MEEMKGCLDRHADNRTKQWLNLNCEISRLFEPTTQKCEHLPHNVIEHYATTEICLDDRRETGAFVERFVLQSKIFGAALQAANELLLEPDRFAYRVVMALPRKLRVLDR